MKKMFIGKAARRIIQDIRNKPNNWETDMHFSGKHYIISNGVISIWIRNGVFNVELHNGNGIDGVNAFNFFEKWAIYRAYKNWLQNKIIESLSK